MLYVASGSGLHRADLREARPALIFDARALPLPELRAGSLAVPTCARLRGAAPASAQARSASAFLARVGRATEGPAKQYNYSGESSDNARVIKRARPGA